MPAQLDAALLYEITCELGPPQPVGAGPYGTRGIIPVLGGRFEGPRLRGVIATPPGGEWGMTRADGVGRLDVRMTLRTHDDAYILVQYTGLMHGPPEAMQRAMTRGDSDGSDYYLRTTPYFETGHPSYTWLNKLVAVGYGRMLPGFHIHYRIYEIL
jgi:hypothetical protein